MMKIRLFLKIACVLMVFCSKTVAQTLTLKQCIDQAVDANLSVKQAGLLADNAAVNLSQAKSNLLPNLNGNLNYGFNQGRSVDPITNSYISQQLFSSNVNLNSGVVLYNGLRLRNLIRQNAFNLEASKMDFQQTKDNLTLNVILAYLQVLSAEDVLAIAKKQLESTQKQVERMDVLVREGTVGKYQLADLKGQHGSDEISVVNQNNTLLQSKLTLCQLMNIDFNPNIQLERTDADLVAPSAASTSSEAYKSALQNLAVVKAGDFRIKSAEKGIKIAESGFYPTVSFNANLGSSYSSLAQLLTPTTVLESPTGDYVVIGGNVTPVLKKTQNYEAKSIGYPQQLNNNLGVFAGLNAQIPIFNNFQTKNRIKLAEIALKSSQLDLENVKWRLRQDIEQAWMNMNTSNNRYQLLAEQIKNFEESYRAAEVRFKNGVINSTEFLIAKNNLDNARINAAQTKYEYIFRGKLLDYYQGRN